MMRPDFPLPDVDWPPTREFWAGAARGELLIPRCDGCGKFSWYPEPRCPACAGERFTWTRMSGRGRLFSWAIVRRAFLPQFETQVPYVAALVALEEALAVRLVTRVVDCPLDALRIDMAVRVVFTPLRFPGLEREVVAPLFVPA
jgi:uncharacterized OB-fold protein